jgi:hypothetical protein
MLPVDFRTQNCVMLQNFIFTSLTLVQFPDSFDELPIQEINIFVATFRSVSAYQEPRILGRNLTLDLIILREYLHSPPTSAEISKLWIYTSTPPYAFMAYCLVSLAQGQFTWIRMPKEILISWDKGSETVNLAIRSTRSWSLRSEASRGYAELCSFSIDWLHFQFDPLILGFHFMVMQGQNFPVVYDLSEVIDRCWSRYIRGDDEGNCGGGKSSFLTVESLFWHKVSAPTIVYYEHADVVPGHKELLPYSDMIIIPNFKEMCHFFSQFLRAIHNSLGPRHSSSG